MVRWLRTPQILRFDSTPLAPTPGPPSPQNWGRPGAFGRNVSFCETMRKKTLIIPDHPWSLETVMSLVMSCGDCSDLDLPQFKSWSMSRMRASKEDAEKAGLPSWVWIENKGFGWRTRDGSLFGTASTWEDKTCWRHNSVGHSRVEYSQSNHPNFTHCYFLWMYQEIESICFKTCWNLVRAV